MSTMLRRRSRTTTTVSHNPSLRRAHDPFVKKVHDGGTTFHAVLCHECADDAGLDPRVALMIDMSTSRHGANRLAERHRGG